MTHIVCKLLPIQSENAPPSAASTTDNRMALFKPTLGGISSQSTRCVLWNRKVVTRHLAWCKDKTCWRQTRTWVAFLPGGSGAAEGHVLTSGAQRCSRSERSGGADVLYIWFFFLCVPPSAVGPTCACWGLSESPEDGGGVFKCFRRTHKSLLDGLPLARRFLKRWRLDFFLLATL